MTHGRKAKKAEQGDPRVLKAVTLRRDGLAIRAITRAMGVSRNTVRRLLRGHRTQRDEGAPALPPKTSPPRPSKLDEHMDTIRELLRRYPDITAQRVLEEVRAKGYVGGYSIVRERVRALRPAPVRISLPTPNHAPGTMAENDWSTYTIPFHSGRRVVQAFLLVPVVSRRKCFSRHGSQDVHALMDGHVLAFERLGGVPRRIKYDNQKAVVLRREGGQPIFNPRFIDFATYYEFTPELARPRHPNDKPRVERGFWELERSFHNGRSFYDEADYDAQLLRWMSEVADRRIVRGDGRTIAECFAAEAPHLSPLPRRPYDTARVVYRLCDAAGCIPFESNLYEVPYEHVTAFLPVRVTQTEVHIHGPDLRPVVVHERLPKGAHQRAPLPRRAPQPRPPDLELVRPVFEGLGDAAADFLHGLEGTQRRAVAHHARKILALRERYDSADVAAALAHALRFGAFDHAAVARILHVRARPRTLDEYVADATRERLARFIGDCTTEPRDLAEYDALPCIGHMTRETAPCPDPNPDPSPNPNPPPDPGPPRPPSPPPDLPTTSCAPDSASTSTSSASSTSTTRPSTPS